VATIVLVLAVWWCTQAIMRRLTGILWRVVGPVVVMIVATALMHGCRGAPRARSRPSDTVMVDESAESASPRSWLPNADGDTLEQRLLREARRRLEQLHK